ncbi:MAG TPA: outer membrane beta-barrel protein [Candidatus Acidoferrales bacterium]|nr:outer membrane beta-barrel protein [Candidatus Acidoferrales bacterium]
MFDPTPLPLLSDPGTREAVAPEDTPVRSRHWPEYQSPGIRYGAWMFNPAVSAGGFYDSNVFSSNTDKEADLASRLGASLHAQSLWERHGLDLKLSALSTIYREHSGLNQNDASLKGQGHFDIDHATSILTTFEAAYLHEALGSLTSPANAVKPTPYSLVSGDTTLRHEFGRFTGSVGASIASYDYGSTVAQNGSTINQDSRDGQVYVAHGRLDYALSEKTAVFTALEGNVRRLRGTPDQSFDSEGYRALVGIDVELTHLIKGEFAGGYRNQRFEADSIGTLQGPTYRAMLTWSPSRRLDIYFNAEQAVATFDTSLTAVLADAAQLGFDYELRRNVIFSTAAAYEKDHFKTQPREDNVYVVDAQLKYLLNNISSISLQYRFLRRDSSQAVSSFDKHYIGITAKAEF